MRTLRSSGIILGVAVGLLAASTAQAVIGLPEGVIKGKFEDASSLFELLPGNNTRTAVTINAPLQVGWENRSIVDVTELTKFSPLPQSTIYTRQIGGTPAVAGLFYDLQVEAIYVTATAGGIITGATIDFKGLGRNPITIDGNLDMPANTGGVVEFYENDVADTSVVAGTRPNSWVELGGPANAHHGITGVADDFPGFATGTLVAEGVFVPLVNVLGAVPPGSGIAFTSNQTVFREVLDFASGTGAGTGYINITGGAWLPLIAPGQYGPPGSGADVALRFDVKTISLAQLGFPLNPGYELPTFGYNGANPATWSNLWGVQSDDPFFTSTVPEPLSVTASLIAMIACGVYGKRRQAAV